jgi:hypothetical protein
MTHARRDYGTARDINPDAGTHAVSAHPDERMAAEAATRQSWREFPYYARRYGERGWKFSLSDSGWITTLSDVSDKDALAQVDWFGGLLASRGMPRYLLERHLFHLHAQLVERRAEAAADYGVLLRCVASLAAAREAVFPATRFHALARNFETRIVRMDDRVPNMGTVLVASIADDAAGVPVVARSVEEWASDPSRFAQPWRDAVRDTLLEARAASGQAVARS